MQFNQSRVVFNPGAHTYLLDSVCLKGITGILSRQLFPNKYDNIPEFVLKRAKERGSFIHENCELADSLGVVPDCEEAKNYLSLKELHGLKSLTNEYLISDEKNFASSIDVVFDDRLPSDDTVSLADIKTTSHFDKDYVSWQLSIYSYLFEVQNPHLKVSKLYGIWLRGSISELIEVDKKPNETIEQLLLCEVNGTQFSNQVAIQEKPEVPANIIEVEQYMIDLDTQLKRLKEEKEILMDGIYKEMEKAGVDNWKTAKIQLIRKKPYSKDNFDSGSLKKEHPEIYQQFLKSTTVKGSVTFKTL